MQDIKDPPAGSPFFKFCEALSIDPNGKNVVKLGHAGNRVVHFHLPEAVRNPDAKAGDPPFAQIWRAGNFSFWFRDDGSFEAAMTPGYMQMIGVTEFNLLHEIETTLRTMPGPSPEVVKMLDALDRVRRNIIAGGIP